MSDGAEKSPRSVELEARPQNPDAVVMQSGDNRLALVAVKRLPVECERDKPGMLELKDWVFFYPHIFLLFEPWIAK